MELEKILAHVVLGFLSGFVGNWLSRKYLDAGFSAWLVVAIGVVLSLTAIILPVGFSSFSDQLLRSSLAGTGTGVIAEIVARRRRHRMSKPKAISAMISPNVLTPSQVSQLLGISVEEIYALLERGELPGDRVEDQWYVDPVKLQRWLGLTNEEEHYA